MLYPFLKMQILRHFNETRSVIDQLTDEVIMAEPVESGRLLGEIVLHMLRSAEFYLRGLVKDIWEALPYDLSTYGTAREIKTLYEGVIASCTSYLGQLEVSDLEEVINRFSRPATKAELLLEMLEHSIQHRGQVLVYYRLLGIAPSVIAYIV
ncbi:MAG: DinB family protein [Candidatus Hodarchaeales archaeon]|jgi:uncharacterized damage-inducible protein DinB